MILDSQVFIPTAWGGGYLTIGELLIDIIILIILITIGCYVNIWWWKKNK